MALPPQLFLSSVQPKYSMKEGERQKEKAVLGVVSLVANYVLGTKEKAGEYQGGLNAWTRITLQ